MAFGDPPILVDYPAPLRGGKVMALLRLPLDLTPEDVEVLIPVLRAIARLP